ncbi:MAG: 50S ribosomal protein L10 [Candidatus Methylacidiphilales bacterium]
MHPAKTTILDDIKAWVNSSPYVIVTDYTGLTVAQMTELRNRLREHKAEYHVVKNTFLRRALNDAGVEDLKDVLKGQSAIAFGSSDMSAAAKTIKTFASEFEKPEIRLGVLDRAVLKADQVRAIAELPPREVLLAQLLGVLNAPATKLATLINTPATQLAQVIKANVEKNG